MKSVKKVMAIILSVLVFLQILPTVFASSIAESNEDAKVLYAEELPKNIKKLIESDVNDNDTEIKPGDTIYDLSVPLDNNMNKTTVYAVPLKYENDNGEFNFIDTSFEELSAVSRYISKYDYKNGGNEFEVKFSKDIQKGFSMDDSFEMSAISGEENLPEAVVDFDENNDGRLTYDNVYGEGTYVEYININSGIKENIVLEEKIGKNRFDFNWESDSHSLILSDDSTFINVVNNSTQEIDYVFSPLYVYDSYTKLKNEDSNVEEEQINETEKLVKNEELVEQDKNNEYINKHNTDDCHYEIEQTNEGKYIITAVVSEDFLNDDETIYPVTIDPSVIASSSQSNIEDTYVSQASPTTNYGSLSYMRFGYKGGKNWGYVRFKTLPSQIHCGTQIATAELMLTFRAGQTTSYTGKVGGISSKNWMENALTWNTRIPWDSNAEYKATSSHHECQYYDFDITNLAKAWYNGDISNYGVVFTYTDQTYNDYNSVYSSEATSANAPCLSIIYANIDRTISYGSSSNNNYNRARAGDYAVNYANYEDSDIYDTPEYYSTANAFNSISGYDCTNFASQCLEKGGMAYVDGNRKATTTWYYDTLLGKYYASYTWGSATYFCKHWDKTPTGEGNQRAYKTIVYGDPADVLYDWDCIVNNIQKGDIIQFSNDSETIDHTVIVQSVYKNTKQILYAQHTSNMSDIDLQNRLLEMLVDGYSPCIIIHQISS